MEISDLQIGDYVCFCTEEKGYHDCKVCGIFNNLVRVIFGNEETIVSINDIKPIPLTKRTLRTIGFRYGRTTVVEDLDFGVPMQLPPPCFVYDDAETITVEFPTESDSGLVTCTGNNTHIAFAFEKISVHEFQHILRMCDIHDLVNKL